MKEWKSVFMALLMVLVISGGHILTPVEKILWHMVFRSLYLLPIVYAGYKSGKKNGLVIAVICAMVYTAHLFII